MEDLAKECKKKAGSSGLFVTLSVCLGVVPIYLTIRLVVTLLNGGFETKQLIFYCAAICLCLAAKSLFYGLSIWKVHDTAYKSLAEIRLRILAHLKKMPMGFFQKRKTGDLTNVINHDVEQIELYLAHAYPDILSTMVLPVIIFISVLILDWRMGLAMISTVPVALVILRIVKKFSEKGIRHFQLSTKKISEDMIEYIHAMPIIKAFYDEEDKTENVLKYMRENSNWVKKAALTMHIPMGIVLMVMELGIAVLIIVAAALMLSGKIGSYQFMLALALSGSFTAFFPKLHKIQHAGSVYKESIKSIETILGSDIEEKEADDVPAGSGDIEFADVSFGYDGGENIITGLNLCFKEKTINAIIGPSGAGKSTLANLLMGFWSTDKGRVLIGDRDIRTIGEESLTDLVSIVQQDVFMFNVSIEENIAIGNPEATPDEIREAARKAQIHEMIESLPDGYETIAGEGGAKLSGGEKQRISIARMILKNTPIIILDEATAAIDPYNEHLIQKAINNLARNKTIIMIAHNLNTITGADQIVVMKDGKVIAEGNHEKLVNENQLYGEMLNAQAEVDEWKIKEVKELC